MEDLMRDAVVLAHRQLLKLALAVALAVGTHGDSLDAGIVLLQPIGAAREASRLDLIQRVLVLFAWFQVGRMVLWEMQEELRAVREAHGDQSRDQKLHGKEGFEPSS